MSQASKLWIGEIFVVLFCMTSFFSLRADIAMAFVATVNAAFLYAFLIIEVFSKRRN